MPSPVATVDDVIVIGRRNTTTNSIDLRWTYRSFGSTTHTAPAIGVRIRDLRFRPNTRITVQDPENLLPDIVFDVAIPAEALDQLVSLLYLTVNGTSGLTTNQQNIVQPVIDALQSLINAGNGLRFANGTGVLNLDTDLMGVPQVNGVPTISSDGFGTIYVNPTLISNPANWGDALRTILMHEILHFSPSFDAAFRNEWSRGGTRTVTTANVDSFNLDHDSHYDSRARRIVWILIHNVQPANGTPQRQTGGSGDDSLVGSATFNDLDGDEGNNTFRANGVSDLMFGGPGNDTYIFGTDATEYVISDHGGSNLLKIEGAYSVANVKITHSGRFLVIGIANSPGDNVTGVDAPRRVVVALTDAGVPCVQTLEVGGLQYNLHNLSRNGRPSIMNTNIFRVNNPRFPGGDVAVMEANDLQGDPLTYSVKAVYVGIASTASWWFSGNILKTNYQHNDRAGGTQLLVSVSDGQTSEDQLITIIWAGSRFGPA